ncbi:MAG: flippase [Candidatus Promineifilaceae bacterium]
MSDNLAERTASNAVFFLASQIVTGVLSLVTIVMLPKFYGATGIGVYHLGASLWAIAALLIGFGTDVVITREVARDRTRVSELVSAGIFLRVIFHLAGFTAVAIFANLAGYAPDTIQVVYIFGIANLIYQIGHIFNAALFGLEKIKLLAVVGIVTEVFINLGILVVIFSGRSIVAAASISILAGFIRTVILFWLIRKNTELTFSLHYSTLPWLLREGMSILLNRLLLTIYVQADVIIISLFVNETVVGWYSVADVAFGALVIIPNTIGTVLFPTMARLYEHDRERLTVVARRALNIVLLFSVPVGLGILTVAHSLLILIVGNEFVNSSPVLAGFGIVTIFSSINIFLSQLLIAMNMQSRLSLLIAIAILLTLPIDLILIPWTQNVYGNGAIGGVISYLITEAFIMIGAFLTLPKGFFTRQNASFALRVLISGCVMVLVVWPLRDAFFLIPVLIGAGIYLMMAFAMLLISREEVAFAQGVWQRGWARLRGLASAT